MANNFLPVYKDHLDEEDYIDIEVSPCSYFFSCPKSSPQNREFEFKMASNTNDKKSTTSPADELFYKGKLLLLHQKFLQTEPFQQDLEEETFCINFLITPIGSCNVSPAHSCRVSFELNHPNGHFFEWSSTEFTTGSSSMDNHNSPNKKVLSKKLNLIKYSLISQKLKASRAYLKSLFTKSSCSSGNSCSRKDMKLSKKQISFKNTYIGTRLNPIIERADGTRSFSAAETKWNSARKCLSSSSTNSSSTGGSFSSSNSSFNSNNDLYELNFTSEIEGSIEAAVAHCFAKKMDDVFVTLRFNHGDINEKVGAGEGSQTFGGSEGLGFEEAAGLDEPLGGTSVATAADDDNDSDLESESESEKSDNVVVEKVKKRNLIVMSMRRIGI
ncbi:probable membrane-associated kinase regulator 4 [Lycium barbarum]|uniref:probable membrane-associated kinase regulator 4 n=1 Tax=Lycium barbarum TaxID=112863 RepID=UPI00293EC458|nr:probable membrane-associated kinase regulator 4 [Lycium barbarum]